jgi:hypothetical protein
MATARAVAAVRSKPRRAYPPLEFRTTLARDLDEFLVVTKFDLAVYCDDIRAIGLLPVRELSGCGWCATR